MPPGGRGRPRKQKVSRNLLAKIVFPIGRIGRLLRKGRYAARVGSAAPIFLAAVLEYITAEILELAGNETKLHKRSRITPRDITVAVRSDEELSKLLYHVSIASGGVLPYINKELRSKKGKKNKGE